MMDGRLHQNFGLTTGWTGGPKPETNTSFT